MGISQVFPDPCRAGRARPAPGRCPVQDAHAQSPAGAPRSRPPVWQREMSLGARVPCLLDWLWPGPCPPPAAAGPGPRARVGVPGYSSATWEGPQTVNGKVGTTVPPGGGRPDPPAAVCPVLLASWPRPSPKPHLQAGARLGEWGCGATGGAWEVEGRSGAAGGTRHGEGGSRDTPRGPAAPCGLGRQQGLPPAGGGSGPGCLSPPWTL